ncbi:MAG: LysR family transcriptional regulator [Alphaproteobacteria bacterium]|nr:LysR family transcriptional regulator [Alphaproteobacteria bacterium]
MAIDPKHLIQLSEIIESGSFTVAARRLNTSQPALSRMASALEAQVGAPVFASRRNPVSPTALGMELANYGQSIRAATEQVSQLAERIASGQHGELRVGAPPFHSQHFAAGFIASWLARHPEIRIVLRNEYAPALLPRLIEGELDLILAPIEVIEGNTGLIVERLTRGENVILCRAGHPLLGVDEITPEMLGKARWISHARDSLLHRDTRLALALVGVEHIELPAFESDSSGAINTVLEHSDMLTVLPELIAAHLVRTGSFEVLPFRLPGPHRPFGYIIDEARETPALKMFRAEMARELIAADQRAQTISERAFAARPRDSAA